jgi:hypothetical protein
MEKANVPLTMKDTNRLVIIRAVSDGLRTAVDAATTLHLSERQVRRLVAADRQQGAAGLVHGNLDGVTTREAANAAVPTLLARHNGRFAVTAAEPELAYRPAPAGVPLERVFCFK